MTVLGSAILGGRRKLFRPDKEALAKVLAGEPPPTTGSAPVDVRFASANLFVHLVFILGPVALLLLVERSVFQSLGVLAVMAIGLLSFHLGVVLAQPNLPISRVSVSGEGVHIKRMFGESLIQWWQHPSVSATPDLTQVAISGAQSRLRLNLAKNPADTRVAFVQAIRVWLRQYDKDIQETRKEIDYPRAIAANGLMFSGLAIVLGVATLYPPGNVLGLRCSANGAYFQQTFRTPARQGCVVLRVSAGAERAGIYKGDLMIELNEIPITSGTQFSYVFDAIDHSEYRVKVIRDGETLAFKFRGSAGKSFDEDPTDPIYYYLRAKSEAADNEDNKAIADFTKAIDIEPRFDIAYLYRGQLIADNGQSAAARSDFLSALSLSPGLGEVHSAYAFFLHSQGEVMEAGRENRRAIDMDNCLGAFEGWNLDCAEEYNEQAFLDWGLGAEAAQQTAEQSITYYPGLAEAHYTSACSSIWIGDTDLAKKRAAEYLAFPASERDALRTQEAQEILADKGGPGLCRP